jgi:mannose/cellobiose epimerase-like protein (N-acyl-D-glucosamine 2-epimerase family)
VNELNFEFSDTIAGYVTGTGYDQDKNSFTMKTSDGREFLVGLTANSYAELVRNMEDPYADATGLMTKMLQPGRFLYAYGTYYPESGRPFEAKRLIFVGRSNTDYVFEKQDWWIRQISSLGDHYLQWQFGDDPVDYRNYRTILYLAGQKQKDDFRQETDTISRLVYGFASAYLLTGDDRYLEGAEKGTEYLRDHMRFNDTDEGIVYWYHGIDIKGRREQKIFASEFGDDIDAIPAYEQIYALAGPIQTYRITGDPRILSDAELTIKLFNRFFKDDKLGGYFSHIDPVTLDPRAESLGRNRGRKNWNSVGDHAPAYLINLWLATGEQEYADMLVECADMIETHFKDYDHSPFVQEKFYEDWSHDTTWGWQQNRGVTGHNLKIAWNLMRINSMHPSDKYVAMARKIAEVMPSIGGDQQRGGWYDVMERLLAPGQAQHRFAWHDRKAWWQQEQGILAYQILNGTLGDEEYLRLARESASFYNAFFLDHDDGGVYFNVLADGIPYLMGTERFKGSHSMSNYHASELCYLSATYINLLITKQPTDFYFKPRPDGFKDRILRVAPDILPPGSIKIDQVWIDDQPYTNFDAGALTVKLPDATGSIRVKVRVAPAR